MANLITVMGYLITVMGHSMANPITVMGNLISVMADEGASGQPQRTVFGPREQFLATLEVAARDKGVGLFSVMYIYILKNIELLFYINIYI